MERKIRKTTVNLGHFSNPKIRVVHTIQLYYCLYTEMQYRTFCPCNVVNLPKNIYITYLPPHVKLLALIPSTPGTFISSLHQYLLWLHLQLSISASKFASFSLPPSILYYCLVVLIINCVFFLQYSPPSTYCCRFTI